MSEGYRDFLAAKVPVATPRGLAAVPQLACHLFEHQRVCAEFALQCGASGCYLDTGLGKTAVELEFCAQAGAATNGLSLILAPLAVAGQIAAEGSKWGYGARVIRDQDDARPGINVCNYDRLDKLDPAAFGAVACDEAGTLFDQSAAE